MPHRKTHRPQSGILITFEGSEGCGKSSQIEILSERLERLGRGVTVTREPGGTAVGEQIRHLLMHADEGEGMCPETELLLFAASRAQLVRQVIVPSLGKGNVVLCDRYLDSTTVYQGVGRQLASEPVHFINRFAVGDILPNLTFVLDIPAEEGLRRVKRRAHGMTDRMESESVKFYESVREGYLLLAQQMPERFAVINGAHDIESVAAAIWDALLQRFPQLA